MITHANCFAAVSFICLEIFQILRIFFSWAIIIFSTIHFLRQRTRAKMLMHPSLVGPVQLKTVEAEIGTLSEASGDYDDETTSSLSEDNKSVSLSIFCEILSYDIGMWRKRLGILAKPSGFAPSFKTL